MINFRDNSWVKTRVPGVQSEEELEVPPEDLCRPYIEKALKDLGTGNVKMLRNIKLEHSDF